MGGGALGGNFQPFRVLTMGEKERWGAQHGPKGGLRTWQMHDEGGVVKDEKDEKDGWKWGGT